MKNPYEKVYHFAAKIRNDGAVSPLCADVPRALNLKRALWTICKDAVTCKECKKQLAAGPAQAEKESGKPCK